MQCSRKLRYESKETPSIFKMLLTGAAHCHFGVLDSPLLFEEVD